LSLREGDKRQIESIVRVDRLASRGNVVAKVFRNKDVVERYPVTFYGVDPLEASEYYEKMWKVTI